MSPAEAMILLAALLGGIGLFVLSWWVERAMRRPGLAFYIGGAVMLGASGFGLTQGFRLLPLVFFLQAIGFLYHARWRSATARSERPR